MHYNFCRVHQTLGTTPAMAAGVTDHVWEIDEIIALLDESERACRSSAGRTRSGMRRLSEFKLAHHQAGPLTLFLHPSHRRLTPDADTWPGAVRTLALITCASAAALAVFAGLAGAAEPNVGTLSVERGKGVVMLDLRGSVLGRLTNGTLRVTDQTPGDRYAAYVVGRKLVQTRVGPRTTVYRGQGLRFRMIGGGYRIVVRGTGIDVEAVGRGVVMLDGEPKIEGEDTGLYSLDGADCGLEPQLCAALPTEPERFVLGSTTEERSSRMVAS